MPLRLLHLAALLGLFAIGLTLWAWGQPLVSKSGEIRLWVGSIWSGENSQQVADWYTLSHILHGMLLALLGKAFAGRTGVVPFYAAAIVTGTGWEIVEHTDWVLGQFRDSTVYQGYVGDTVLNAVMDYVFMLTGFWTAWALRPLHAVLLALALEIGAAALARDSLALSTLNFFFDVPWLDAWQDEINPRTHPELLAPAE
ncbi:MAG: DUF2585 family protein [Maritimibacter sp.]|nr:DUF2585 family protein [Maritimibacter sp.]